MMEKMTSRTAAGFFTLAGVILLGLCLVSVAWQKLHGGSDPTDKDCRDNLKFTVSDSQKAAIVDGRLQLLGVWPELTSINRHVCVAVGGVVSTAAEAHLSDEIVRARKARDDAQAIYDNASGAARDTAWDKLQVANTTLSTTLAVAASQPKPVELSVFLNGKTIPDLAVKAYPVSAPQILRILLKVPANAGDSGATFWRELLSASTATVNGADIKATDHDVKLGQKAVVVGLSRSAASMPEAVGDTEVIVAIYNVATLWAGILSFLCFALGFCGLARQTTLLRDNAKTNNASRLAKEKLAAVETADADAKAKAKGAADISAKAKADADAADDVVAKAADEAAKAAATDAASKAGAALATAQAEASAAAKAADDAATALKAAQANALEAATAGDIEQPTGPYSLARTQIAFWMFLTIGGFVFIWLTMGLYLGLITAGILVLLGISATSGLAAISLNGDSDKDSVSKSFFLDILSDGDGPALHRIQAVAWTCILGILFTWNVVWNFTFIDFDTNLLLLIGVAQGMYLGFKWQEAPAKPQ
ncbi:MULTISPECIES: hypothetical protein [unclassified Mesorhizobium]|uniref:hypothetical protein n=1 Tax=unclassified Mesorhizobium TaxID=325217 RepID=UPI00167A913D|nr:MULTISPECIES: hypothetical protein [unclassified Mesorhizobium]